MLMDECICRRVDAMTCMFMNCMMIISLAEVTPWRPLCNIVLSV